MSSVLVLGDVLALSGVLEEVGLVEPLVFLPLLQILLDDVHLAGAVHLEGREVLELEVDEFQDLALYLLLV